MLFLLYSSPVLLFRLESFRYSFQTHLILPKKVETVFFMLIEEVLLVSSRKCTLLFYAYPIFFHQDIAAVVRKIEPEKSSKVREAEKFLTSNPKCASAPQLNGKVNEANNKYDKINLLLKCSEDK